MSVVELESLHSALSSDGVILQLTLNHGRVNEMGSTQLRDWEKLTHSLHASTVRAVITESTKQTSRGTPIFIAGADVTERVGWDDDQIKKHVRWQRQTLAALRMVPVFHIAVVDGLALGWGTEFLITADYRIATPNARFSLPETGIGILPGAGGTSELSRIVGINQALRLGMTGEQIDANEALRIGLIDELAADAPSARARAMQLAKLAARRSPTAAAAFKHGVLSSQTMEESQRQELEAQAYELCVDAGEAAIGRANFKAITSGETVKWGPRKKLQ
jgi:enoyl-CoA hydratase/carnithine racemase